MNDEELFGHLFAFLQGKEAADATSCLFHFTHKKVSCRSFHYIVALAAGLLNTVVTLLKLLELLFP